MKSRDDGDEPMITQEIQFIDNGGEIRFIDRGVFIGQLKYDIKDNTAFIHSVYLFPEYRGKGILKSNFEAIVNHIKSQNVTKLTLKSLSVGEVWKRLGFLEKKHGEFEMEIGR